MTEWISQIVQEEDFIPSADPNDPDHDLDISLGCDDLSYTAAVTATAEKRKNKQSMSNYTTLTDSAGHDDSSGGYIEIVGEAKTDTSNIPAVEGDERTTNNKIQETAEGEGAIVSTTPSQTIPHIDDNDTDDEGDPEGGGQGTTVYKDLSTGNSMADLSSLGGAPGYLQITDMRRVPNCCAVCLGRYRTGERIVWSNNCIHAFHCECILDWLVKVQRDKTPCPCCRQEFTDLQAHRQERRITWRAGEAFSVGRISLR